jgi:hypothetical protein
MAFNISFPINIKNIFANWLRGVAKKDKVQIQVGIFTFF